MIIDRPQGTRVWAAMSGGVDSAVAAALLVQQGYAVEGVFMDLWDCLLNDRRGRGSCCSPRDRADAEHAARRLGIPLRAVDLRADFRNTVVQEFVEAYGLGLTPNPCIRCNQWIKYDRLLAMAREAGADLLATGHYAINERDSRSGRHRLKKAADPGKDQSYFLFTLQQSQLAGVIWPVGKLGKPAVRSLARELGLAVADKSESQEICFIPDHDYRGFLESYLGPEASGPGEITDTEGTVLGSHAGVHGFTVGQRRGLGIPWKEPLYVLRIVPGERRVVVGPRARLGGRALVADGVSWVAGMPPAQTFRAQARIRYRHQEAPAEVRVLDPERIQVRFDTPQPAITPGQAVVLYDGDEVLGGGWIRVAVKGS